MKIETETETETHDKSWFSAYKNIRLNKSMLSIIFIPSIILILLISLLSYIQVHRLITANNWVVHTYQVIQYADSAMNNVLEIESDQRAYLITGDNTYTEDFDQLRQSVLEKTKELKNLTNDNPQQLERINRFNDLIIQRLDGLHKVIQLKQNNKLNTPEGMSLFTQNQSISDHIKLLANEIESIELVLLNERNKLLLKNANTASVVLIAGSTLSLIVLLIAYALVNIELSRRVRSDQARKNVELRLRNILESASDMIAAVDNNYRFIIFNDAYQQEFKRLFCKPVTIGMSLDQILNGSIETCNANADELYQTRQEIIKGWKESLAGGEYTKSLEIEIDQQKNVYEITSSSMKNDKNEITGAVHIIRNITKRVQEQLALKESYEKLDLTLQDLKEKNNQITLLVEMSDIMLACSSQEELKEVMSNYCQVILKFASGYLYVMHPSKNYLEAATSWGNPNDQETMISPEHCWAIRLGRMHLAGSHQTGLLCAHIKISKNTAFSYLCKPLMAQNDIYGLLYMEVESETALNFSDNQLLLINAFSELTALALANVRLRENLRYQSIRDPLTGLYNRRYLEDFLFKQIHQAERTNSALSVLMLDLDHFKKINDTFGHDAGDAVLKELGRVLVNDIRVGDIAARYGGEEFILVFYNTDMETAKMRAEDIRHSVSMLQIKYGAQQVGPLTISIGIAVYPNHGKNPAELIEAADKALYVAKNHGRDQVVEYSEKYEVMSE